MRLRRLMPILLALLFIVVSEDADAQRRNKYQRRKGKNKMISKYRGGRTSASRFRPYYYGGVTANALNYFGDLAPVNKAASTDISFTRPGFGLFYGYKFHHSFALRAAFNYGRLFGDDIKADPNGTVSDKGRYYRNLSFRNDIKELSLGLEVHLLPTYGGPQSRPPLNGYLFFGVAVFHGEPKAKVPGFEYQTNFNSPTPVDRAGEWVNLRELETEGESYSAFQFAIPVALGGDVYINQNLSVGLEFGFRKLFFDRIDDVSGSYVNLDEISDPLARILSDRSLEPSGGLNGEQRDLSSVQPYFNTTTGYYSSGAIDSGVSTWPDGDGGVKPSRRGNSGDNDMYFMTQLRITYIFGNTGGRAKFR